MKQLYLFAVVCLLINTTFAQDLSTFSLEANYPFSADGSEGTSTYGDADLDNATVTASGVYSNGLYNGNDPGGTVIKTQNISGFETDGFAIQLEFYPEATSRPILMCGDSWRWLELKINSSGNLEIAVSMTNGFAQNITSSSQATLNQWQSATIIFRSDLSIELYHDGSSVKSETIDANLAHNNDFTFSNQDGGLGYAFMGYWKNLNIYSSTITGVNNLSNETIVAPYPNPASKVMLVTNPFEASADYLIIDQKGDIVSKGRAESDAIEIAVNNLARGSYLLQWKYDNRLLQSKFIVQ